VTLKGQTRDPNSLKAQYLENYLSYRDFKFGMQLCMGNAERDPLGIPHTKLHTKFEVSSSSSFRDIAL